MSLIVLKLLLLTVKHVGGGSSFIRRTAAGGTGKTPPGTGCKPGAVGTNTSKMDPFMCNVNVGETVVQTHSSNILLKHRV